GGIAVVSVQGSMIGRADENGPQGSGTNEDVSFTLNTVDRHGVAYPTYSASKNSHFTKATKELAGTLVATDYKDPPLVNDKQYVVRRLTPTECARLQGFPSWWCSELETAEPTEADLVFFRDVFETYRLAVKPNVKPKTDKQIEKWLREPYSDSAAYKMWGNGVALPCVVFVLSGILWEVENGTTK
ncbi:DNA cytosine methyltransferase, partial [Listeria monocytogenes]|nr:DNA cytosine methyltransferase [Listeria monocytogenes]